MPDGSQIAGALVQLAAAGAAVYGAVRCVRLQRFASDRRLTALAWFFSLFAAAMVLQALWQAGVASGPPAGFDGAAGIRFNGTRPPPGFDRPFLRPEGAERVNILFAGAHAFMLASLVVAVWAFGHRRRPDAATVAPALALSPFALVGTLVPLMLALEAGLTLYLACRALINHVERRSVGAVQVALGFLLFFVGHFLFYLAHQPGMGRSGIGDILGLVGIALLVQALPGTK
ncbi:MAG: hypothetical protein LC623_00130 [Halobacteriales archaeon]|nr:hypothetical protein [Halobacteriales archaeon]